MKSAHSYLEEAATLAAQWDEQGHAYQAFQ